MHLREDDRVIGSITEWILSLSGGWALAVVFLGPALESSAFVGFVFPGEIAVLLGGVLAFQGRVSLGAAIAAAVLGAITGDTVGYWVGRRWGQQILRWIGHRIPFLKHRIDEHLETARAYLKRRGGRAVLLGRFTAALRVMVPGLAGMADMHYPTFLLFNALGGALWGTAFVVLGYFAGAAWKTVAGYASKVGFALLALIIIGLVLARLLRNVREGGVPIPDRLAALRAVAWFRRRYPGTSAWLAERVDTTTPRGFLLSLVVSLGAFSAWVFGAMAQDVVAHEEAVLYDRGILRFAVAHRTGWLTEVMKAASFLGSNLVLVPVVVGAGAWLVVSRRAWRPAIAAAVSIVGADVLYQVTKVWVGRPRPPVGFHLVQVGGYAFPSGHATQALAGWVAVAVVLASGRSLRTRVLVGVVVAILVLLIGVSRIYFGIHWFTDVVGGFALGGAWLCVVGAVMLWTAPRPDRSKESESPNTIAAA
jgi:membrane protein DedA with SNARE-associated domain/membrane-associated phospholipid phosphatase